MKTIFTADSFGSECPVNYEKICAALNSLADDRGITDDRDALDSLWESYCAGELGTEVPAPRMHGMISLDNGHTFMTAHEAMPAIKERNLWDTIVEMMDSETRESIAFLSSCETEEDFLAEYLSQWGDLIIG